MTHRKRGLVSKDEVRPQRCSLTKLASSCEGALIRFLFSENVSCAALLSFFLETLCGFVLVMLSNSV